MSAFQRITDSSRTSRHVGFVSPGDMGLTRSPHRRARRLLGALLAAVSGLLLRGMSVDILAQIGFVVPVALASKNAILIVEFAKQAQDQGASVEDAAVRAARTRLRPILMTSLAFILGVVPLAIATGAGAEMRQSLGTTVFFGMLGVTLFGLLFTPTFYTVVQSLSRRLQRVDQHTTGSSVAIPMPEGMRDDR
jgi:predicted RND superfamily exporter protein